MRGILEKEESGGLISAPVSRVELKGFVEESGVRCELGRCMFMFLVVH